MMKTRLIITTLCAALLAGCGKDPADGPGGSAPGTEPIGLSAKVISAPAVSKAPVEGDKFGAANPAFFLTALKGSGPEAPTDWRDVAEGGAAYFANVGINSTDVGTLNWPLGGVRYYPVDGSKLFFYAYAPQPTGMVAGSSGSSPKANYDLSDGQADILAAQFTGGKVSDGKAVVLAFTHKLMRVCFTVKADAVFDPNVKLTKLTIRQLPAEATLDVSDGTLTFSGNADLTAYDDPSGVTITKAGAPLPGKGVMIAPRASLSLDVTTEDYAYKNIPVTLSGTATGQAGTNHLVTLTFSREQIVPTAQLAPWDATAQTGVVDLGPDNLQ